MTDSDWELSGSDSTDFSWPRLYANFNTTKLFRDTEQERVKRLIESGEPISPSLLWGVVHWKRPEVLDLLLSAGADPNRRHAKAEEMMPQGKYGWAEHDWLDRHPERVFLKDKGTYFPLHLAALEPYNEEARELSFRMVGSLLRHGADPYAVFASQLEEVDCDDRELFPGGEIGLIKDPDEVVNPRHLERIDRILGEDHVGFIPNILLVDLGLRSVIHAVLVYGYFEPFLDSPEFMRDLKLEHRDPQGRTLFLSACRRSPGADEQLDNFTPKSRCLDSALDPETGARSRFPPGIYPTPRAEGAQPRTAIQALLDLGADPLVTDNQGKNALHQLLEAGYKYPIKPPMIGQSLRHLMTRFPSLVNQADRNGMHPIHTALRRLWKYVDSPASKSMDRSPENCVLDLIKAGADVHARDGQGNTVLHYLADGFLDAYCHGERRRRLFYLLLDEHQCASYIDSPNHLGQTPIQLMLCHTERKSEWHCHDSKDHWSRSIDMEPIDAQLFAKFDQLGTDWTVRDKFGRTLLHNVAQTTCWDQRVVWRCKYLIQKGVDPLARDFEGKTARELVGSLQDRMVRSFFAQYKDAEANDEPEDASDNAHATTG